MHPNRFALAEQAPLNPCPDVVTLNRNRHVPRAQHQLAPRAAIRNQGLIFSTVGGAKTKADDRVSHALGMIQCDAAGNPVSDGEY